MTKFMLKPSLLSDFYGKRSQPVEWLQVYNLLLNDTTLQHKTARYRQTHDLRTKQSLACITPAVQLNGTGKEAADVVGLTAIAMADFDHLPAERIEEVRVLVNADPHTFLSYVTVSGDGLRVLFRFRLNEELEQQAVSDVHTQAYASAFLVGNCYYADLIGHPFDEKCCNINRLSALCHDPQVFFNYKAKPFDLKGFDGSKEATESKGPVDPMAFAVRVVERRGECYVQGNRHSYLMKCVAMMNRLGVSQWEAERWALGYDLGEREIRTLVKSVYHLYATQHGTFALPKCHDDRFQVSVSPESLTHTRAREEETFPLLGDALKPCIDDGWQWPERLHRMIACGETEAQKDVITLSALVVLGALTARLIRIPYGHKTYHPNLQMFVIAPPASGKGCISWVRKLAEPKHKEMMRKWATDTASYRKEKIKWDISGNRRAEDEPPVEPKMAMFLLTANNSSTGIQENLMDANGHALICEVEADTMSESLNADYGGWSDLVRKAFEHERLAYNRRANHEYREIDRIMLSVLLSGTPAQVKPLIPSAENGLYSRQIFYNMPAIEEWIDQFNEEEHTRDYDQLFLSWGEEWKSLTEAMERVISVLNFKLSTTQRTVFNERFARLFHHAGGSHDDHHMKSSVARLAINILRMMGVLALLRALEKTEDLRRYLTDADFRQKVAAMGTTGVNALFLSGNELLTPVKETKRDNQLDGICTAFDLVIDDADFHALLTFSEPLYRHAMSVLRLLPSQEAERREQSPMEKLLENLPMRFSYAEARAKAEALQIVEGTLKGRLYRMKKHGQLLYDEGSGIYEFSALVRTRAHVCV